MRVEDLTSGDPRSSLYAAHRKNGKFFNPWSPFPHSMLKLLRFWIRRIPHARTRALTPRDRLPVPPPDGGVALTWIGHCTFAIQRESRLLLTDPHWGRRARIRRRKTPPGVAIEAVPDGATAVVSHNHYDHLDRYSVKRLPRGTRWFVPLGLSGWLRRLGHREVVELDWWQRVRHDGWTLTCLPAQHWSLRLGQPRDRTLWCSWLIECGGRVLYFSGDSGYFHGFQEFGRRFGPVDAAFLPIATYEPQAHLAYQHMDPAQAWQAALDLRARHLVPMHWGTFQLGQDPTHDAPRSMRATVAARRGDASRVRVLDVGETWILP